jgi:hypothetical protein
LRDSLPIDMLLSAVSVLVVAQSSSEVPERLMNNPVFVIDLHMKHPMNISYKPLVIATKLKTFLVITAFIFYSYFKI